MVDFSQIVSVVQINDVRLLKASFQSLVLPSELAEKVTINNSHSALVKKEPGEGQAGNNLLLIHTNFSLDICSELEEEGMQCDVKAVFELSYNIRESEEFSSEEYLAFAEINSVFNAWPYWREFLQSSLSRMGMPTLTVPVLRIPTKPPEENDSPSEDVTETPSEATP